MAKRYSAKPEYLVELENRHRTALLVRKILSPFYSVASFLFTCFGPFIVLVPLLAFGFTLFAPMAWGIESPTSPADVEILRSVGNWLMGEAIVLVVTFVLLGVSVWVEYFDREYAEEERICESRYRRW